MSTCMHDRYYEPEDSDLDDIYEALEEHIEEMVGQGGECEWSDPSMFYEALSECGIDEGSGEERITPENCGEEIKKQVQDYAYKVAKYLAEQRYL